MKSMGTPAIAATTRRRQAVSKSEPGRACGKSTRAGTRPIQTISSESRVAQLSDELDRNPEAHQRRTGALDVVRRGVEPEVEVVRRSWTRVERHRVTADHQVPDSVGGERRKHLDQNRGAGSSGWRRLQSVSESSIDASKRAAGPAWSQKARSAASSSTWFATRPPDQADLGVGTVQRIAGASGARDESE